MILTSCSYGLVSTKRKTWYNDPSCALVVKASAASFPNVVSGEASGGANCHNRLCSHQSLCSVLECSISYAHVLMYIGSLEPSLRISIVDILESRDPERCHSIEQYRVSRPPFRVSIWRPHICLWPGPRGLTVKCSFF